MKKKRDYALSNQWNPWRKMLIFKNILVIFVLSLAINAQGQQRTKVTLDLKNVTLNEIITELKKQTDYDFFYNSELAKSKGQISVKAENKEVKQLLDEILPKLGLEYAIQQNLISIREKKTIELIKIEGKVTDEQEAFLTEWNTKPDGSGISYYPGELLSMPEQDITLYAQYGQPSYALKFELNGGTLSDDIILPDTYSPKDQITVMAIRLFMQNGR